MKTYFLENWLAIAAFIISIYNTISSFLSKRKETVNLKCEIKFGYHTMFMWYDKTDLVFIKCLISNVSKTDTSITKFSLISKNGETYDNSPYGLGDRINKNGISFRSKEKSNSYYKFNLKSENFIHNDRLQSHGSSSGFITFFEVPYKDIKQLKITTPTKTFLYDISIEELPEEYIPEHPV